MSLPPGSPARELLAAAAEVVGGPAWLVGGAVRDLLTGRSPEDLDLALPGGSVEAARRIADRIGGAFVPLGEAHGVGRVVPPRSSTPATPVLDLADFRGPTLAADLAGRDVTVDALAVEVGPLLAGPAAVIDPVGGLADLDARRLRSCGPDALTDDPVRVLRLLRLAHQLGYRVEPETAARARAAAPRLGAVPGERVREELTRLLRLARTAPAIREGDGWGVMDVLLPAAAAMRAATQSAPHRFTVWEHSIRAVEAADALLLDPSVLAPHDRAVASHLGEALGSGLTRREVLKLAALVHDVAKPRTRTEEADGRTRFIGHDRLGAEDAAALGERLRWPGRATRVLTHLVRHHLRPMHLGMLEEVSAHARYRFLRDVGSEVPDLVCLTIADAVATDGRAPAEVYRGPTRLLLESLLTGRAEVARTDAAPPLLTGHDVMTVRGLAPGPAVGRLLRRAREAQGLGILGSREEALRWLAAAPIETPDAGSGASQAAGESGGPEPPVSGQAPD